MRILFIHGRAQQEFEEAELKQNWTEALHLSFADAGIKFPKDLKLDFVYYAKELIAQLEQYEQDIKDGKYLLRGLEEASKLLTFEHDFIIDLAANGNIDKRAAQEEFGEQELDRGRIKNSKAFTYLLRAIDKYVPGAANYAIRSRTADVGAYLVVPGVKRAIHRMIIEKLTEEPTIIIAHSLGTIIAYNILHELQRSGSDIRSLITLGSPLGVEAVQRQLTGRIKHSAALRGNWHNLYDPLDIVSLNPLDEEHFPIDPEITNYKVDNLSENRHGILYYLSSPHVSKIITDTLGTGS